MLGRFLIKPSRCYLIFYSLTTLHQNRKALRVLCDIEVSGSIQNVKLKLQFSTNKIVWQKNHYKIATTGKLIVAWSQSWRRPMYTPQSLLLLVRIGGHVGLDLILDPLLLDLHNTDHCIQVVEASLLCTQLFTVGSYLLHRRVRTQHEGKYFWTIITRTFLCT